MDSRRVKLTKRVLKETLIEQLQTVDLSQLTVKALCEKADVNRSTFYAHYADLYALFEETEDEFLSHIAFVTRDMTGTEMLKRITDYVIYVQENKATFFALIGNGRFIKRFTEISMKHNRENKLTACGMTAEARSRNLLTAYTVTGSVALLRQWLEASPDIAPEEIAKLILSLTLSADNIASKAK